MSLLTLDDLAARAPAGQRLLIFADGSGLIDPRNGEPEAWLADLERWPERVLLTPEPTSRWGYREWLLRREGLKVVPANPKGLAAFGLSIDPSAAPPPRSAPGLAPPLPSLLCEDPARWLDRREPTKAEVRSLLKTLHEDLGADGYRWLVACAVFPTLHWELTFDLGHALKTPDDRELYDEQVLVRLCRLPWFIRGSMPDWLRCRLKKSLSPDFEAAAHRRIDELLDPASSPGRDEFLVDVAIGESAAEGRGSLRVVASLAPRARRGPLGVPVSRELAYLLAGGHEQASPAERVAELTRRARRAAGALVLVALLNLIYPLNTWTHAPGELPLPPVALCLWAAAIAWCFGARRAFLIGAFLVPPAAAFAWNILAHPGKWAGDGPWIAIDLFALGALGLRRRRQAPGTRHSGQLGGATTHRGALGLDRGGRLHRGQLAPQNYSHTNRVPCVECRKPVCLLRGDSRRLPRPGGQGQSSRPGRWGILFVVRVADLVLSIGFGAAS